MVTEPCKYCVDPEMCLIRGICIKNIIDQGQEDEETDDGFTIPNDVEDDEIINENFGIN